MIVSAGPDSPVTAVDWEESGPGAPVSTDEAAPASKGNLLIGPPQVLIPWVPGCY